MSYRPLPMPEPGRPHYIRVQCENEVTETVLDAINKAAAQVVADTIGGRVEIIAMSHNGFAQFTACDPVPDPVAPKPAITWFNVEDRVYYDGEGEGGETPGTVIAKKRDEDHPDVSRVHWLYRVNWDGEAEALEDDSSPKWFPTEELRPCVATPVEHGDWRDE
jgi:hypothetical protein